MKKIGFFLFYLLVGVQTSFSQNTITLSSALKLFSETRGIKLAYEHNLVANIQVKYDVSAVKTGSAEEALRKILEGTGIACNSIGKGYFTLVKETPLKQVVTDAESQNLPAAAEVPVKAAAVSSKTTMSGYAVKGTVTESKTGKPIAGVTMSIAQLGVATVTDARGNYSFTELLSGSIVVRARFLTMVSQEREVNLEKDQVNTLNFSMNENVLTLKEVLVVAAEGKSGGATASIISQKAIEHLQATSLNDILQLLPGALAGNPDFSNVNKAAIRQLNASNMGSLGTAVMINGSPVSNNANLQALNPASAGANANFSTSAGSGTDLRQINADNIESVEVIRGVPSAEYGDLTNGAILVKTKAGVNSLSIKARVNPVLSQFWAGQGFSLGKNRGSLNADFDYTKAYADQRYSYNAYNRVTGSLLYSNSFFKNKTLFNSTGFSYAMNLDEQKQDPDDIRTQTKRRAQDQAYRFSTSGRWNLRQHFARVLNYNFSVNYAVQKGYQQELLSNYIYPISLADKDTTIAGQYVPSEYLSKVWIEGRPFNLFAKITNSFYQKTGSLNHRFLVGAEWRTDANFGSGKTYDVTRPPRMSGSSASRLFSYNDIPALNQLSVYAEDHISGSILNRDLDLQFGLRYDNVQPADPVRTRFGRVLAPRVNLSYQLDRNLTIRAGYGITAKAPTLLYLYPQDAYFDLLNLNYYSDNPAERLVIVTTRRFNSQNDNLKIATNNKAEIGFEYIFPGNKKLFVTAYSEKIKNGYDFGVTFESLKIIPVANYGVSSTPSGMPPVVDPVPRSITSFAADYNQPTNNQLTRNKGVEFDLDLGRFDGLRTSFVLNGAWMNTQSTNSGYYIVKRQLSNQPLQKVGVYAPGRGNEYTRASSTLRVIHNIPEARLIVTLAAQTIWTDKNKYLGYESLPVGYINTSNSEMVWLSEAERTGSAVVNDAELNMNIQPQYYLTESWKPLWLFNLRLTKEIGRSFSFSFFANNVLMNRPLEESTRWSGQYSTRNPRLFFGTELNVKF